MHQQQNNLRGEQGQIQKKIGITSEDQIKILNLTKGNRQNTCYFFAKCPNNPMRKITDIW